MEKGAVGSLYWKKLREYDYMAERVRYSHKSHEYLCNFLLREKNTEKFRFLDCGVLSAVTLEKLETSQLNVDYMGIDIAEGVVRDCRRRYPQRSWQVMDVQDLAFPDDSFSIVHIRHTLEHLPYYEKAIREAFRVANEWVILGLFLPLSEADLLERRITKNGTMLYNQYGREPFLELLNELSREYHEQLVSGEDRDNQLFFCRKRGGR